MDKLLLMPLLFTWLSGFVLPFMQLAFIPSHSLELPVAPLASIQLCLFSLVSLQLSLCISHAFTFFRDYHCSLLKHSLSPGIFPIISVMFLPLVGQENIFRASPATFFFPFLLSSMRVGLFYYYYV